MKLQLKLVVASMSLLGLINSPVFAATQTKHKTHKVKTQTVTTETSQDYKTMGALPVVESCPRIDMYTMLMDRLDQNVGRAKPTMGCDNPISFAGGIAFDSKWGNRSLNYAGENNQRVSINDAYINIFGNVTDWATGFASLSYSNFTNNNPAIGTVAVNGRRGGDYSRAYSNQNLNIEQAFATLRNWSWAPVFVQLGKQFQPFGRYTIHPMTRSLDQVLTETLATSAEFGFIVPMGIHGTAYVFDNPLNQGTGPAVSGHTPINWGAELGWDQVSDQLGWDMGVGYLYNMTAVNDVGYAVGRFNGSGNFNSANATLGGNYSTRVAAGTLYADVNSGPFSVGARYASALTHFNVADLGNHTINGVTTAGVPTSNSTSGAKPWAGSITAAYGYNAWGVNQDVYLSYQLSGQAVNIFLPKTRWQAGVDVAAWKNTMVGLQYNYDHDYGTGVGATGSNSSAVNLRVAVKFG